MQIVILGIGSNAKGDAGRPYNSMRRALDDLKCLGLDIIAKSRLFVTAPVGRTGQPPFLNAVVVARTDLATAELMRGLKRIERRAGRRLSGRWGARALDIDIIDHGGRRIGSRGRRRRTGSVDLPHPEMASRAFVLIPLLEVLPHWWHAGLRLPGRRLAARLRVAPGSLRPMVAQSGAPCIRLSPSSGYLRGLHQDRCQDGRQSTSDW